MQNFEVIKSRARRYPCLEQLAIDETADLAGRQGDVSELSAELWADARRLAGGDNEAWSISS